MQHIKNTLGIQQLSQKHKRLGVLFLTALPLAALLSSPLMTYGQSQSNDKQSTNNTEASADISATIHNTPENGDLNISVLGNSNIATPEANNNGSQQSETSLTVNGQNIPVPDNGTLHTTVPTSNDGASNQDNIDIRIKNKSDSTSSNSNSSVHIDIDSHSVTSESEEDRERRNR